MKPPSKHVPFVEAIGGIGWVLPDEYQITEESLRQELRRDGVSKAEIDEIIARGDWWGLDVSVRQYAEISDGGRVFDPVYLGVWIKIPPGLSEAEMRRDLTRRLDAAFREEMKDYEDWDCLIGALARVGHEVTLEELLALPLTVRLATPEDGPVPLPEF